MRAKTFELVPNPHGRPSILRAERLGDLVDVALSSPAKRGLPFAAWSVAKLAEYCRTKHLLPEVTHEWVCRLLRREGLSAHAFVPGRHRMIPTSTLKKAHSAALRATYRRSKGTEQFLGFLRGSRHERRRKRSRRPALSPCPWQHRRLPSQHRSWLGGSGVSLHRSVSRQVPPAVA